jgi:catechol 2,3-dioxygenase-like lactoylglutathione lyase family enzyme
LTAGGPVWILQAHAKEPLPQRQEHRMELGAFSVSLAVKDIEASKSFYEKLGFAVFGGDASQNWLILKNGDHVIGLFKGMFEKNMLTFNPGWDANARKQAAFTDVRDLQRRLKAQGVSLLQEADEGTTGPASFMLVDPDGNPILFDQHV